MNQEYPTIYKSPSLRDWFKEGSSVHGAIYVVSEPEKIIKGIAGVITDAKSYENFGQADLEIKRGMYLVCTENCIYDDGEDLPIGAGRTEYLLATYEDGVVSPVKNGRIRLYDPIENIGGAEATSIVIPAEQLDEIRRRPPPENSFSMIGYGFPRPRSLTL